MISNCTTYIKYQIKQQKQPLMAEDMPQAPWEKVGTDLFHFNGKDYLLLMDYYSNFLEMAVLTSTTAHAIVVHIK